jgi:hypothetical protein
VFLNIYNPENLPPGYSLELFNQVKDYILDLSSTEISNTYIDSKYLINNGGDVITWRVFDNEEDLTRFRTDIEEYRPALNQLVATMNLNSKITEIVDQETIEYLMTLANPTYDDFAAYLDNNE